MKIIDAHFHLGDCRFCEVDYSEDKILETFNKNNLTSMILQAFPIPRNPIDIHKRISDLSKKYPGKFYGIISINPHCDKEDFIKIVHKIINMGGFVGIKLHTLGHLISPLSSNSQNIYEVAIENNLPVMVHTGLTQLGEPSLVLEPAKKYPQIKFVLAHSGWSGNATEAMISALNADNIYLETSWIQIEEKRMLISRLGSKRIMLGSDSIDNLSCEINQYYNLNLEDRDLENIFFYTAKEVFKLK